MTLSKQLIITTVVLLLTTTFAFAKVKIPLGKREVLNIALDLPDTEEFTLENGNYLDIATLHEEFNIAYILPLYITKDPKLVGYDAVTEEYYDITENELNEILTSQNIKAEDINKVPFYAKYGGKLLALIIISLIAWSYLSPSKKNKVEPTNV